MDGPHNLRQTYARRPAINCTHEMQRSTFMRAGFQQVVEITNLGPVVHANRRSGAEECA